MNDQERKIDELLSRGVENIFPSKDDLKKVLMSGKKLKLYCGYDPSAPSLHIGHAISINKLAQFQALGHEVIFLVGDFTGMIGDPTDKLAARKKLTRAEVLANATSYQKQASAYLNFDGDNPAKIDYNSRWSDQMTFKDVIEIASNFTVQQMLTRDMFQKRIEENKPIYLHEFLYPLAQGYDSVGMDVDLEIGGNDQMFNMLCGRDLQRAINNKEKFVLTLKLLADDQGKKMGKSEGNAVFMDTNPNDMFGSIMSWPDGVLVNGFELCTNIPMSEVEEIRTALKNPENNPRDFKLKLAFEITKINHGEEAAQKAQEYFINTFSKRELPTDIREMVATNNINIVDFMTNAELASSKSDARRKIEQGGVSIDSEKVTSVDLTLDSETCEGKVVKVGKKDFVKIVFEK